MAFHAVRSYSAWAQIKAAWGLQAGKATSLGRQPPWLCSWSVSPNQSQAPSAAEEFSMEIKCIAGFSVITKQPNASASLYREMLGLPLERYEMTGYHFMDKFPGANHFGVWPLEMAAQSCFGQGEWPA